VQDQVSKSLLRIAELKVKTELEKEELEQQVQEKDNKIKLLEEDLFKY